MTPEDAAKPTLWFDVEDLFAYAETESRPSGIQRLAFEVHQALSLHPTEGGRVRFLRHHPGRPLFVEVEWEATEALFKRLVRAAAARPRGGIRPVEPSSSSSREEASQRLGLGRALAPGPRPSSRWRSAASSAS